MEASDQTPQPPADTDMPDATVNQDQATLTDAAQVSEVVVPPVDAILDGVQPQTPLTQPTGPATPSATGDMPPGGGLPASDIAAAGPGPSAGLFATASIPVANGTTSPAAAPSAVTPAHATQLDPTLANKLHIIPPANEQGSPTRVYINTKVTPYLLEGMKWVGANEPEKPLKWLGEYLLKKSAEVEGT